MANAPEQSGEEVIALKRWFDELKRGDNASHIYRSDSEQVKVITDLIAWMKDDEKLLIMSDRWDSSRAPPRSRLLDAALEDGHLDIVPARSAMSSSGRFRAESLMDSMELELSKAKDEGCSSLIFIWDLDWIAGEPQSFEDHIMHRSRLSLSPMPRDLTIMGQYGLGNFSLQQVERVERVSPLVLEDGQLNRNFWVVSTTGMGGPPRDTRSLPGRSSAEVPRAKSS